MIVTNRVHSDFFQYGVPMHRIRYYKINGRIVWDRTNKIDILTGSEQQNQVPDGMSQNKLSFMN